MIAILIIIIIILIYDYNYLKKENNELKRKLRELQSNTYVNASQDNSISRADSNEYTKSNQSEQLEQSDQNTQNIVVNERPIKNVAKPNISSTNNVTNTIDINIQKQKSNNKAIFVCGSTLIILSAIVFLLSTWNLFPNIVKSSILILLIGVFLGISKISKKVFKLEQASKTFYYIAMAYIPIVLFSISFFKLLGEYLSFTGEGKFLYFSISSIFLSVLYSVETIKRREANMNLVSMIFQVLSIVFISLTFVVNIQVILLGCIIYTIFMPYICKKFRFEDLGLHHIPQFCEIVFNVISIITLFTVIPNWITSSCSLLEVLIFIFIAIHYYLLKDKKYTIFIYLSILSTVLTLINIEGIQFIPGGKLFVFSFAAVIIFLINYYSSKIVGYKIVTYILLNLVLYSILQVIKLTNLIYYIPFLVTMIIMLCEKFDNDKNRHFYIILGFLLTFISLNCHLYIPTFFALLVAISIYMMYTKSNKINNVSDIAPLIAIIPSIFIYRIFPVDYLNVNIILGFLLVLSTSILSIMQRKENIYTISSIVYLLLTIIIFKINTYLSLILILIWSYIHICVYNKNNIYKVLAYLMILLLYTRGITDLSLEKYTIFKLLGYLSFLYIITRTIIKKSNPSYKYFEYFFTSLIYLYTSSLYSSISDAMICIIFLLFFVFIGYAFKVGSLFLVSLIAIVINIFLLTQAFWYSIPWWVYMLTIGSVLIFFAIRNEAHQKKEKVKLKELLKKLKERVDL